MSNEENETTEKKEILEKVVETPSVILDKTITISEKIIKKIENQEQVKQTKKFWKLLGPGLTTGAADDDPSGIATYSQIGAKYSLQFLWLAPLTFPFMAIVQEMCARLGMVTGKGLAANIKDNFPRWVLYICTILLFAANTLNIGADLGAMAKAVQLVFPGWGFAAIIIFFVILILLMEIFLTYEKYANYLKYLALILLSYIITAFVIPNFNWSEVLKSIFVPNMTFGKDQILLICAVLGTTISPYLFFWETSQEVEENILAGQTTLKERQAQTSGKDIKNMRVDVWSGMFLSNLVMFFIIAVCAMTLSRSGVTINTAADAASALRPLAGNYAFLLFALGIIGTGMLAIPILAGSASYAFAESFGWKSGLNKKLRQASSFYGIIIISTLIGLAINFLGLDSIKMLIYSAVANGIIAPVILVLIIILSSKEKIMGKWKNSSLIRTLGWVITIVMILAGLATIFSSLLGA